jgi:NifU-like protein involved in Fe-S cluster formation
MSATLYNTAILRLAASIPLAGRLDGPQASVTRVSPVCGSKVTADVDLDGGGRVVRFAHDVRACALGQASAALLAAGVIGATPGELATARDALAAYLKGDASTPGGWPGLDVFDLARPHKARHGSILLAFQAAADAAAAAAATTVPIAALHG